MNSHLRTAVKGRTFLTLSARFFAAVFILTLLVSSVFAQSADLNLDSTAGQIKPDSPFYFLDTAFDDLFLNFNPSEINKLTVANERFAEGVVQNNTGAIMLGERLLAEVESRYNNTGLNASEELNSRIVLARVIRRIAIRNDERNQILPFGLIVAYSRIQVLAGRVIQDDDLKEIEKLKDTCNSVGYTFVACARVNNTLCAKTACLPPESVFDNSSFVPNEDWRINKTFNASQCIEASSDALKYFNDITGSSKVMVEVCPAIKNMTDNQRDNLRKIITAFDQKCAAQNVVVNIGSLYDSCQFSTCNTTAGVLQNSQYVCDKSTNMLSQCRLGIVVNTERRCGLQAIFGGGN